jgi:hypothetical protein
MLMYYIGGINGPALRKQEVLTWKVAILHHRVATLHFQSNQSEKAGCMAQAVKHLPSKHKALTLTCSTAKKKSVFIHIHIYINMDIYTYRCGYRYT